MKSLAIGTIASILFFVSVYVVLFHKCTIFPEGQTVPVKECKCYGKKVNFMTWLGVWDTKGDTVVHCVGIPRPIR